MSGTSKRRNSEKRKEKSRDAARFRRSKETEIFTELSQQIPACSGSHGQLDKASVMRLGISHLKINKIMEGLKNNVFGKESQLDYLYPKALEGFVAVLSQECDIVYISENVVKYLGIPQIDLIGQSMYEFAHPRDHDEVSDIFFGKSNNKNDDHDAKITFFMRMKCTLTSKGRSVNLKSASYKVIRFSGRMIEGDMNSTDGDSPTLTPFLVLVGEPIPHPSNIEVPLDSKTFLTRHNMDMTFTYCDERIKDLVGYNSQELIDQSLYSYHHAADSELIAKGYKDLFAKGQMMTEQYRLLAKRGGYVWVITQGTIIYNSRTQKPQCVVCVHFVLSDVEDKGTIMSVLQKVKVEQEHVLPTIKLSTEDVFQPKPKNIRENDFYFPSGVKIKGNDNTVDLTHLAPTAGDICIDLPFAVPVAKDQMPSSSNVKLISGKKLKEEPGLIEKSLCSKMKADTVTPSSSFRPPFGCSVSPAKSLSPVSSPQDYNTTLTPGDVEAMNQFFSSMDTDTFDQQDPTPLDMDMRAPYIPMNAEEDFNLLPPTSEALFSLSSDFNPAFFGRTESIFIPRGKILPDSPKEQRPSLRDMLSGSTAVASIEQPPDTFHLQTKRPFDVNSLEKGPPVKRARNMSGQNKDLPNKTSVLLNLLVSGEDRATGYSVKNKLPNRQQIGTSGKFFSAGSNPSIPSPQGNSPMHLENLLQESDLMQALENFLPSSALI